MGKPQNRLCVNLMAITLSTMVAYSLNIFLKSVIKTSSVPNNIGYLIYFIIAFIIALLFFNYHKIDPADANKKLDD